MTKEGNGSTNGRKRVQLDLKWVVMLVGFIATLGGFLSSYWKNQLDMHKQIWDVRAQTQREQLKLVREYEVTAAQLLGRIELLEQNIDSQSQWQTQAIEQLADAIPSAVREHELQKHGTKAAKDSTPVKVELPEKPTKVVHKTPPPMTPDELDLLLKKKKLMMAN